MKALSGFLPLLAALLVASCAKDGAAKSGGSASAIPASLPNPAQGARVRDLGDWASSMGGSGYTQDDSGHWIPKDESKRSSFERIDRDSPYFKGQFTGTQKQYKTGEYARKTWWGNKDYGLKEYSGNTDGSRFQTASRFGGKTARDAGKVAVDGTRAAREGQNQFATSDARESGGKILDHPSDAQTDVRRRVFVSPVDSAVDWRQQRQLSVEQTKGILGKD